MGPSPRTQPSFDPVMLSWRTVSTVRPIALCTATLVQDRERRREALRERLRTLHAGSVPCPLRVDGEEIRARLEDLSGLLQQDSMQANAVFRQLLAPITMTPVDREGKHFYRATGTARGAEMLNRLGVAQAVDFGGCGGLQR